MTTMSEQLGLREVIKIKPVRQLWLAQIVSVFGDFLAIFAVLSYLSFKLHASAAQVTFISVSFMILFALIGPWPASSSIAGIRRVGRPSKPVIAPRGSRKPLSGEPGDP